MTVNGVNGVNGDATTVNSDSPQVNGKTNGHMPEVESRSSQTLLSIFLKAHRELESYKGNTPVKIDGQTLSVAGLVGVARHQAPLILDDSPEIKERIAKTRQVVEDNVLGGFSVYGLSTGFGGSADTRSDEPILLGEALLQHQYVGTLPTKEEPLDVLPLLDPATATTMPEAWVRGAIMVRMNSMIRGHSAVRWEIAEKLCEILKADLVPCIPIHGSVSASGDLAPLSYIAGTLTGNPRIRVYYGPRKVGPRSSISSTEAFRQYGIEPAPLASKEHLSILNGTAFSTSVGSLAIHEAIHLALLGQVCTAMGVEAMMAAKGSFHPFLHAATRPHPGQVECAHNIWTLLEGSKLARVQEQDVSAKDDQYTLRQDRYSWRAVPQFLGPQLEDLLAAFTSVTQECNSTTDNPLIDAESGKIHYGANFQAMAITNAMEKTRLALHHIGKTMFAQTNELVNPTMNNGLPPSVAATDPSLNYHVKGLDITIAAYTAELGYLASPVSTHIQSAEMHNQSINSMALVSARATINSIHLLSMLSAGYLYILCQALDIRALQAEFITRLPDIVRDALKAHFGSHITPSDENTLMQILMPVMRESLDKTTIMDNDDRMRAAANATAGPLSAFLASSSSSSGGDFNALTEFCKQVSTQAAALQDELRKDYLTGARGPTPASPYLGKTKAVYEFIRGTLGIKMHGYVNYLKFSIDEVTVGDNTSIIYEAIRDGKLQSVVASLFE